MRASTSNVKPTQAVLVVLICLAYAAFSYASDLMDYTDPSQVVKAFCQSEFEGVPDQEQRDLLVRFSKQRNERSLKEYNMKASWVDTIVDELILVSHYEVGQISVQGTRGVANVVYQQLAVTKGVGIYDRSFIKAVLPNQTEQLNLRFDGKRWWIYNSGLPRVSSEFLRSENKEIHQRYLDREKKAGLSTLDIKRLKKLKESIEVLESLDK